MITVSHLSKHYGTKKAVDDISFTLGKGEVVGFLGPNGAGKTTTMNMLTGYISSTSGKIEINGYDILEHPLEAKKSIGYLPEIPPLYVDMTVNEYLSFVYDLKRVTVPRRQHLSEVMELAKISHVKDRLIRNLSKGYRQRTGLAQALIGNPDILILDEPTVGLDPVQMVEMRTLISELGKEKTVILSSHILPEISAVCERIIIINQGKIVADKSGAELQSGGSSNRLLLQIEGDSEEIIPLIYKIEGVKEVKFENNEYQIDSSSDIRSELFSSLSAANKPILMMKDVSLSLEDVFINLVSEEDAK